MALSERERGFLRTETLDKDIDLTDMDHAKAFVLGGRFTSIDDVERALLARTDEQSKRMLKAVRECPYYYKGVLYSKEREQKAASASVIEISGRRLEPQSTVSADVEEFNRNRRGLPKSSYDNDRLGIALQRLADVDAKLDRVLEALGQRPAAPTERPGEEHCDRAPDPEPGDRGTDDGPTEEAEPEDAPVFDEDPEPMDEPDPYADEDDGPDAPTAPWDDVADDDDGEGDEPDGDSGDADDAEAADKAASPVDVDPPAPVEGPDPASMGHDEVLRMLEDAGIGDIYCLYASDLKKMMMRFGVPKAYWEVAERARQKEAEDAGFN